MSPGLRKSFILFLFALFLSKPAKAQLVYIPDLAFRGYLYHNFTACMIGDSIDPNCPAVLNAKKIDVSYRGISDLSGIEVFINDSILICSGNNLTFLPALPSTLERLDCSVNQLTALPALPNSLDYLNCTLNQLTSLPALPDSLKTLYCFYNQLSSLPALPNSLATIVCASNQLTSLPALPDSLFELNCSINQLTSLPALPDSLKWLLCDRNQLTSLPALPDSLFELNCEYNQLTALPALPSNLTRLNCQFNQLTALPALPNSLDYLNCNANQLTSLPALPDSLFELNCEYNQLTALPALPSTLTRLNCQFNQLTALPALPDSLKWLLCDRNQLTSLPALPDSLFGLSCAHNQLTALTALPNSLLGLNCIFNQLTSLPALPDSLVGLSCAHNQLTSLPALPSSLSSLWCDNNPLTCLPDLNNVIHLRFANTLINCLPGYGNLSYSHPPFSGFPLCDVFNSNGCDVFWNIEGKVYLDSDTNCIPGQNEQPFSNQKIILYKNGVQDQQTYSNNKGDYDFNTFSYDYYTTETDTSGLPFEVLCPASGFYTDTISAIDSMKYDRDFALKCKEADLAVTSIYTMPPRPAALREVKIQAGDYSNFFGAHCASGISGTLVISISGPCSYHAPAPGALVPDSSSSNFLRYNIQDFGALSYDNTFNFILLIDTTATAGSQVCIQVSISTSSTELNYNNNFLSQCFTVVNSFDPNDKSAYPLSNLDISGDRWLNYTIRFQNTGTAPAEHIYITDTLSTSLDWSSFSLLSYSHLPITQVYNDGLLKFSFPHINLPDSNSNEPQSHGYVQFKIRAKDSLAIGTTIENTANIFFDFNPPIITNTTSNAIINCSIPPTIINVSVCENQSYQLNDIIYSASGSFIQKHHTYLGCDSLVILNLNILPANYQSNVGICQGSTYNFNGQLLSAPGIYIDTLTGILGCDSIVELSLSVNNTYFTQRTENICTGDSIFFDGVYLNQTGIYSDTLFTALGCDSIIELNLTLSTFNNIISQNIDTLQTTQSGTTYQWINCSTNTIVAGAVSQIFVPTQSGNYAVVVSDGLCTDTSNCIFFSGTGIDELNAGITMNCSYSTETGCVVITIEGLPGEGIINLTDLNGRNITTYSLQSDGNLNRRIQIPATNLARGMYLIHLSAEKVNWSCKLVK